MISCIPALRWMDWEVSSIGFISFDPTTRQLQQIRASLAAESLLASRYSRASRKKDII